VITLGSEDGPEGIVVRNKKFGERFEHNVKTEKQVQAEVSRSVHSRIAMRSEGLVLNSTIRIVFSLDMNKMVNVIPLAKVLHVTDETMRKIEGSVVTASSSDLTGEGKTADGIRFCNKMGARQHFFIIAAINQLELLLSRNDII
jgi:hypothetical protein